MTTRTRYFVILSLLVLAIGLGTGLVAYYVGRDASLGRGGLEELQWVSRDAAVVAYADVQDVMRSEIRQRIRDAVPASENGPREFLDRTGIDIEHDIDRIVAALQPHAGAETDGLVLARGRFDEARIESLMRERGADVESYKGKRLIAYRRPTPAGDSVTLSFVEPGLVAVGSGPSVRAAIDLERDGDSVANNTDLMNLIRPLETADAWAVGRMDRLLESATLPDRVARQIPPVTWFSMSGRVDDSVTGVLRADARDEEAAASLRDLVRGLMALARLQAGTQPLFQALLQSFSLSSEGKTVSLSFSVPGEAFDAIGRQPSQKPQ